MKTIEMAVPVIESEADFDQAMARLEALMDIGGDEHIGEIRILGIILQAYDDKHYPLSPPDPIEAIKFAMDQLGYTNRDLAEILGAQSRVSEVMNKKRRLTVHMIRRLHDEWGIPYESLFGPVETSAA